MIDDRMKGIMLDILRRTGGTDSMGAALEPTVFLKYLTTQEEGSYLTKEDLEIFARQIRRFNSGYHYDSIGVMR